MNHRLLYSMALIVCLSSATAWNLPTARADDSNGFSINADNTALISLGMVYFDVFDDSEAAEFHAEYRSGIQFFFRPFGGAMATSDGSVYGYGGVLTDFQFGSHFILTPSIAGGLYFHGDGKDLGHVVEIRSAIEAAYRFDNHSRLGLLFYHISNAGLDDDNAGTEVLGFNYSFPVN